MACPASTYGADSLTNRWPAPLTRMQPGRLRSARQKYGPPRSGMDGPHQASSISPVAAPRSRPARIPSPVFPAVPVVHSVPVGARRDPRGGAETPRMPAQAEPAVLGLGDGHGGGQVGPGEMSQLLAEHPPTVKRNGLDTAPRGQPSRCLWVIVRIAGHPCEA